MPRRQWCSALGSGIPLSFCDCVPSCPSGGRQSYRQTWGGVMQPRVRPTLCCLGSTNAGLSSGSLRSFGGGRVGTTELGLLLFLFLLPSGTVGACVLCCDVLFCAVVALCCAVLCCTVLCCVLVSHPPPSLSTCSSARWCAESSTRCRCGCGPAGVQRKA